MESPTLGRTPKMLSNSRALARLIAMNRNSRSSTWTKASVDSTMSARSFRSATAASTRASSVAFSCASTSSLALASYCRLRPRRDDCTRLTSEVGWNGRSRNVTLPSVFRKRSAAGLRSMPPPRCVSRTNGKSDHSGWRVDPLRHRMQVDGVQRFLRHQRKACTPIQSLDQLAQRRADDAAYLGIREHARRPLPRPGPAEPGSIPALTGEVSLFVTRECAVFYRLSSELRAARHAGSSRARPR